MGQLWSRVFVKVDFLGRGAGGGYVVEPSQRLSVNYTAGFSPLHPASVCILGWGGRVECL